MKGGAACFCASGWLKLNPEKGVEDEVLELPAVEVTAGGVETEGAGLLRNANGFSGAALGVSEDGWVLELNGLFSIGFAVPKIGGLPFADGKRLAPGRAESTYEGAPNMEDAPEDVVDPLNGEGMEAGVNNDAFGLKAGADFCVPDTVLLVSSCATNRLVSSISPSWWLTE